MSAISPKKILEQQNDNFIIYYTLSHFILLQSPFIQTFFLRDHLSKHNIKEYGSLYKICKVDMTCLSKSVKSLHSMVCILNQKARGVLTIYFSTILFSTHFLLLNAKYMSLIKLGEFH